MRNAPGNELHQIVVAAADQVAFLDELALPDTALELDEVVAPMVAEAVVQEAKRAGDARFSVETGAFTELGK